MQHKNNMPFVCFHLLFHILCAFSYFVFCVSSPLKQTSNTPFPLKTFRSAFGNLFLHEGSLTSSLEGRIFYFPF